MKQKNRSLLAVKNIPIEGLGTFKRFIKNLGYSIEYLDAPIGNFKADLENFEAIIILGGPMGIYEYEKFPFLKKEFKLVEMAIKKNKKLLGICLGAQIIAHVLGAKVYKGTRGKEIGWYKVKNFHEFKEMFGESSLVFQWHGDTFDLPAGAVRLSSSKKYQNQAFRFENAYALQFHPEVSEQDIKNWIKTYKDEVKLEDLDKDEILGKRENWKNLENFAEKFIYNFLKV